MATPGGKREMANVQPREKNTDPVTYGCVQMLEGPTENRENRPEKTQLYGGRREREEGESTSTNNPIQRR